MSAIKFLRTYLFITLAFGALSLVDNILTFKEINFLFYSEILSVLAFFFFFFNIITIAVFKHYHIIKIAYVLPVYHLVTYLLLLWISIGLILLKTIPEWSWLTIIVVSTIFSLFEIGFSTYLLIRLKLF
ncbi:MAG: hypothetical protein KKA62_02280 [Nanoarchaeota archaeon]|nr:hypothetical protein [Nanoarchaeota archaeon]MBU1643663.1 hypothetical protein [Nanoarchaeota archaeon]MBU1976761.1 hypothetical protein [Nanoarchaeota archaeon]